MRKLTADERQALENNGCRCSQWDLVEVADPFRPEHYRFVNFSGNVALGTTEETHPSRRPHTTGNRYLLCHGAQLPCGKQCAYKPHRQLHSRLHYRRGHRDRKYCLCGHDRKLYLRQRCGGVGAQRDRRPRGASLRLSFGSGGLSAGHVSPRQAAHREPAPPCGRICGDAPQLCGHHRRECDHNKCRLAARCVLWAPALSSTAPKVSPTAR